MRIASADNAGDGLAEGSDIGLFILRQEVGVLGGELLGLVCGACARTREIQRVEDVHAFPGHIACDSASNSELVLPVVVGERLVAVFDLDSPLTARFDAEDARGFAAAISVLATGTDWA